MESIKSFIPYEVYKYNSKRNVDYLIKIDDARSKIKGLGLLDSRSATKFVPDLYKYNSEDVRLGIINGLLDTDGSVTKDCGVIEYVTKSKRLCDDFLWLIRSIGINCSFREKIINE